MKDTPLAAKMATFPVPFSLFYSTTLQSIRSYVGILDRNEFVQDILKSEMELQQNNLIQQNSHKPLKMRWVMISFAFIATVLNYIHRLSFNYLSAKGHLRDLIPDDSFGYIATAFFIAYMISNGISGFVIDKLGTRIGYALCVLLDNCCDFACICNFAFSFWYMSFFTWNR